MKTALNMKNITKIFPGVVALDNVCMNFEEGTVHGIVGENGAGKSTLIKILTGAHTPTEGTIELFGETYENFTPREAIEKGISAIYQELILVPYLTVAENIYYGREKTNGIFLKKADMNKKTKELCREMEVDINPKARVKDLGVAYQQIVEIVKAVSQDAKILVMDEPSAPLTTTETDAMFNVIRKLKKNGVTILYISHRLEEVFEICDFVSILRDGKHIKTARANELNKKEIISYMVGRELGETFPGGAGAVDQLALKVNNLTTKKIKNVSFSLKKGEILGFGGLVGAGRTETAMAIFGNDSIETGSFELYGKKINIKSPKVAIEKGIGLIPEDRKKYGLVLSMQVKENITYCILDRISKFLWVSKKKERKIAEDLKDSLTIKTPSLNQITKNLSGGNQQKIVLAKWLARDCDILVFDEPTRGIDVGAKQEIYNLMHNLSEQGKSIIMISSEMPELIGMSDRIIIMYEGKIVGELAKNEFSQDRILEIASCEKEEICKYDQKL
jgi:ribose transport system ATP-binding protein